MEIPEIKKTTEAKMQKAIEAFRNELTKIRTGRAHTGLLEHIRVDYYGTLTALNQVATLTMIDARTIGVQPWEKKLSKAIEKAISESDLGLNPQSQGDLIRVPMPGLTQERRKELVKVVKAHGETSRVGVRNLRRDANNQVKELVKKKLISEDDERRVQDELQKITDKHIAEIDHLVEQKEKEVMAV